MDDVMSAGSKLEAVMKSFLIFTEKMASCLQTGVWWQILPTPRKRAGTSNAPDHDTFEATGVLLWDNTAKGLCWLGLSFECSISFFFCCLFWLVDDITASACCHFLKTPHPNRSLLQALSKYVWILVKPKTATANSANWTWRQNSPHGGTSRSHCGLICLR